MIDPDHEVGHAVHRELEPGAGNLTPPEAETGPVAVGLDSRLGLDVRIRPDLEIRRRSNTE